MATRLSADTRRRIQNHIIGLGSGHRQTAQVAEARLMRFGGRAVEALIAASSHADPQVRFRAVWVLGKSRDSRALPAILALTRDSDARVSYDAVLALGYLGDARAIPILLEIAKQPADDRSLDSAATMALVKLGVLPEDHDDAP